MWQWTWHKIPAGRLFHQPGSLLNLTCRAKGQRSKVRIQTSLCQGCYSEKREFYLLVWIRKDSSCSFSVAVIISSTSVNCSGSAPLTCRDARIASIRWDFSSRRLSIKYKAISPSDVTCSVRAKPSWHRDHSTTHSLAVICLKQASLYQVCHRLQRKGTAQRKHHSRPLPSWTELFPPYRSQIQCFTL